ncbi:DUF202 domain-containing protein [Nonomuraea muscovyensis]|jgi:uncharacterized membrane protein YidH (DUF202 family)|uniref:Uncharacterized membrane protein YidH (DUF202 family) n=1 Tax=Nonomuraea muscovyensis TaxID=1124761 RepID=A0A7X0C5U9_9ACTN|nr:DUF202 domain-containing protein [Nonomuraea muscovyensis]MBB6349108.1 uncharacterized membrane protein YidH (DUF202 family) [Nonomuraea muscovyensis]MDF2705962.1 hypothetical protein [Nonomuraea muscovyensis]
MSREIWDPGLQSERTRLAWVRTAVMLATGGIAGAGLVLRHGPPPATGVSAVAFALAALSGAVLLTRTGVRFRRVQGALHGGRPVDSRPDALLAWLGTLCAVAGAAVFVLSA